MDSGAKISALEATLQELTKEWERFFAGVRKTPPVHERVNLQKRLRQLVESTGTRPADSYRLQQLQHRFMTYAQMWDRMLREREEGRGRSLPTIRAAARAGRPSPANSKSPDVSRPPPVDEGGVTALYEKFVSAKREAGEGAKVGREAFENQIEGQRRALEERFGCKVRFDVVVDGGKVKLAARKTAVKVDGE